MRVDDQELIRIFRGNQKGTIRAKVYAVRTVPLSKIYFADAFTRLEVNDGNLVSPLSRVLDPHHAIVGHIHRLAIR